MGFKALAGGLGIGLGIATGAMAADRPMPRAAEFPEGSPTVTLEECPPLTEGREPNANEGIGGIVISDESCEPTL